MTVLASGAVLAQGSEQSTASTIHVGRVSGVVFDSLRMLPAIGANVWISGSDRATVTDSRGRFEIDRVPAGSQQVAFSSAALDSLGFKTYGAPIEVKTGQTVRVPLAIASHRTIWRTLCGTDKPVSADSGILWGTVRDASTQRLLYGASVTFRWYESAINAGALNIGEVQANVRTDSTGSYIACGLPADVELTLRARGDNQASGDVAVAIGARALRRVDLSISGDMYVSDADTNDGKPASALGRLVRKQGNATIRGVVMNSKGQPVPGAQLSISSADTVVRAREDGAFRITRLPGGTQTIEVRSIGYALSSRIISVQPDAINEVNFVLPALTTLATFNVRTEKKFSYDKQDFDLRRRLKQGTVRDLVNQGFADASEVLQTVPRLTVVYARDSLVLEMRYLGHVCHPVIYVDRLPTSIDQVRLMPIDMFRVVEVFAPSEVPIEFGVSGGANACGVVAFWSKYRW